MPTVLRHNGINLMVYTHDHVPKHVHCFRGEMSAIVDIKTLRVHHTHNVNGRFLREIVELVSQHRQLLLEKWDEIEPIP